MTEIVPMRLRHVARVAELERLCFAFPWSEQTLIDGLGNPQWAFFVAEDQGQVAGYAGMMFAAGECFVANLAVFPAFRRRGVATALLLRLLEKARAVGGEFLSLEVRPSNRNAIALYEKLGFSLAGRRRDFYDKPREDGLIYTKWL